MRSSSGMATSAPSSMTMTLRTVVHLVDVRPELREERAVDEDDLVLRVVRDVDQLLGEQPDVEGVQHAPAARHREVELEVGRAVPAEGADAALGGDTEGVDRGGGAADPDGPGRVVAAVHRAAGTHADDRLVAEDLLRAMEDVGQGEGVVLHLTEHWRGLPGRCHPGHSSYGDAVRNRPLAGTGRRLITMRAGTCDPGDPPGGTAPATCTNAGHRTDGRRRTGWAPARRG